MAVYQFIFFMAACLIFAAVNSMPLSQSPTCTKEQLRACSSYFNESECCRLRGDALWMMNIGSKESFELLKSVVNFNIFKDCSTSDDIVGCFILFHNVARYVSQFLTTINRIFGPSDLTTISNEINVVAALKAVIASVESNVCDWVRSIYTDQELHVYSLISMELN
jgi:hypothetical protein